LKKTYNQITELQKQKTNNL